MSKPNAQAAPNNVEALSLANIPAGGAAFRDAWIAGPLDAALLARKIKIGFGTSEHDRATWKNKEMTVQELAEFLCTFQRGEKDGDCILQGTIAEAGVDAKDKGRRLAKSMAKNYLAGYDIDSGDTIEEIAAKIPAGTFAIIWSTHSHAKTEKFVSQKTVKQKLKLDNPTALDIADYLMKRYKAKARIFEGASDRRGSGSSRLVKKVSAPVLS